MLAAHAARPARARATPADLPAPFPIVPSVPALDLAEGSVIRFGDITLDVLHTPGTHGRVGLPAGRRRSGCCSRATRCSRAPGGGRTCPAAPWTRWSSRSPAWRAGPRPGRPARARRAEHHRPRAALAGAGRPGRPFADVGSRACRSGDVVSPPPGVPDRRRPGSCQPFARRRPSCSTTTTTRIRSTTAMTRTVRAMP